MFHNAVWCEGSFVISQTEQELDCRERYKAFLSATVKRPAMGPNQFPIQYPGRKRLGREFNQPQTYRLWRKCILRKDTPTPSHMSTRRTVKKLQLLPLPLPL